MTNKLAVVRNIFWNCAGMAVTILVGFVLAPFLIRHLGDTRYGLWIVIGSLTSYCGLIVLGVRACMGRHLVSRASNTLVNTAGTGAAKAICCFREDHTVALRPALVRFRVVKDILGYSIRTFLGVITRMSRTQLTPVLVASLLELAM